MFQAGLELPVVAKDDLEFPILLPPFLKFCDNRCVLPHAQVCDARHPSQELVPVR